MPAKTHGLSKTYLYRTWTNMKQRCHNEGNPLFPFYGAKGVSVCERWLRSFEAFVSDMGERPSDKHSIDRIDVTGDYEPNNCRWATRTTQARNMRKTRTVEIAGTIYLASDLADLSGHKTDTIIERAARGFSYAEVIGNERLTNMKGLNQAWKSRSKKFKEATHCQKGHAFTPENTRLTKEGWKRCRICQNARAVALRARKKSSVEAPRRGEARAG